MMSDSACTLSHRSKTSGDRLCRRENASSCAVSRVAQSSGALPRPLSQPGLVHGHGLCVLVVEDNVDVAEFAVGALRELDYTVVLARNADQALAALEQDAARFHVMFSDVVMPGTNGLDLARNVRSRFPDLPIILTSGYSELLARDPGHGFTLLRKPYSLKQLAAVMTEAGRQRSPVPVRL